MTDETNGSDFDEIDRAWMDEAARRYEMIQSGRARTLAHDEVVARLERRVGPTLSDSWKTEIERRGTEIDEGRVELIDNEEVFESVRESLRKGAAEPREDE